MRTPLKPIIVVAAALACAMATGARCQERRFRPALPGYTFEFPRDHFAHPDFKTEWWYYTGNLTTREGALLGFELTFFREGIANAYANPSRWRIEDLYLAHFAVSNLREGAFRYHQRMHRGALGLAGATRAGEGEGPARIWVGDWSTTITSGEHRLQAASGDIAMALQLHPLKAPVIHGSFGISRKGPEPEDASHYYSFSRMQAGGTVRFEGKEYRVTGLAWMDHEFSTNVLPPSVAGWDWFSLQFDDGSELMLYQMRRKNGARDPFSAGTYIPASGGPLLLGAGDFRLTAQPGALWTSPRSAGRYPMQWQLKVPSLELELEVAAALPDQELLTAETTGITYWEGPIRAVGKKQGADVFVRGYLEMTGYTR